MIVLLSNDARLRKAVKEALAPVRVTARKVTVQAVPDRAHAVVTTAAISSSTSFLAMRLETPWVFVLPEALAALGKFCNEHRPPLEGESDTSAVVLAGSDLANIDSLARADLRGGEQEVLL